MTHCAFLVFFRNKVKQTKMYEKSGPTFHIVNHIFAKNIDIQKNKTHVEFFKLSIFIVSSPSMAHKKLIKNHVIEIRLLNFC